MVIDDFLFPGRARKIQRGIYIARNLQGREKWESVSFQLDLIFNIKKCTNYTKQLIAKIEISKCYIHLNTLLIDIQHWQI